MAEESSFQRERLRREAADWVARLQGPATEADRAAFRRWRDSDPANAAAYDRVKAAYDDSALLALTEVGRQRRLALEPRRRSSTFRYAIAAGVATVALISGVMLAGRFETARSSEELILYATNAGEIREVGLPDGLRMILDTRTSVMVDIGGERRRVTLRDGRARFAVAAANGRPLVVEAGRVRAEATASVFDVALIDGQATVQAIEGSVEVRMEPPQGDAIRLRSGELIGIPTTGEPSRGVGAQARWPERMLAFDDVPLGRAIAEANRYAGRRIVLADPALERLRVTGTFRAGDLEGLARSLAEAFGLRLDAASRGELVLHPDGA